MSIIYSKLPLLFKLSQELNEFKEYIELDGNDIDNIKELADNFINNCIDITNITIETDDENFMVKSFLNSNFDLLDWIFKNYCPIKKRNYLQNLLHELQNENDDLNYDLNIINQMNNDKQNFDKNEINIENNKKLKDSHDTVKLIEENDEKYKNQDINKKSISDDDFSNNNFSNSIYDKQTYEVDYSNNIIIEEKENKKEEEDEEYEEEEEEDDDDDEINNNINNSNNKNKSENDIEKENNNNIINHKEENNKINDNKLLISNEKNDKSYNNDIKNENNIINNEENEEEDENEEYDDNEEIEKEKIIQEKRLNELNNITNKTIKEHFELFISDNNGNKNFNNIFMTLKSLKNDYNKFEQNIKEKILTLLCTIYPFCSSDQKRILKDINIKDENIRIFLYKTLLYFEEDNNLYKILACIPSKKSEPFELKNNLKIDSKAYLIALYQFLVIYKSFNLKEDKSGKTFDKKYFMKKFYFISFKIYFILSNVDLYHFISKDILEIYEQLLFIKKFYSSAFIKKIQEPFIISQIKKFKEEFKKYSLNSLNELKEELFDENEKIIIQEIFKTMKHFYKIDEKKGYDLLKYSNNKNFMEIDLKYNFVDNISDIIYMKYNLIYNKDIKRIKEILNCLEKNIKALVNKNNCYSIKKEFRNIYNSLISEIKEGLKEDSIDINKIKFYPLTLFLPFTCYSSSENKLIIFVDILNQIYHSKIDIFFKLENFLKNKYKASKKYDSKNIKISFDYKKIKVKILFLGHSLYIQTFIFREYSLLDQRFPILVLTLNYFLNKIGLIGTDKSSNYLCLYFQYLLISFLQDIINPPILPKILNKDVLNIQKIPCKIEIIEKKINSIIYKCLHIPKIILDKEKIAKIYNEQIKNNQNKLTCAEIFLKFLEFIIYYFKFDTIYSDLSYTYEGFNSINNIFKMYNTNNSRTNINPNDLYFIDYFYDEYSQNKDKNIILIKSIAEPFDNIFLDEKKNFKKFYEKIKKGYEILIYSGSFDKLNNQKNKK